MKRLLSLILMSLFISLGTLYAAKSSNDQGVSSIKVDTKKSRKISKIMEKLERKVAKKKSRGGDVQIPLMIAVILVALLLILLGFPLVTLLIVAILILLFLYLWREMN